MNNLIPNNPAIYSSAFNNKQIADMREKKRYTDELIRLTNELKRITGEIVLRAEEYAKQQSPDGGMVDTSV